MTGKLNWISGKSSWIIIFLFTIPTFISLARPGYFPIQDVQQPFRIQQLDKCIQDNQIPCRWIPDGGLYYGYPQFNYYPSSVYYAGEFFHILGFQFIDALKIMFILGFIVSGLTMYLFLRSIVSPWAGIVGTVLYIYAPYKAVDTYVRGDLNEFWSLAIFPLIFWSSRMLLKSGKLKYLLWFAVSLGLLLTTHNLMTLIFAPVAAIWVLVLFIQERKWRRGIGIILGGFLGWALGAFFNLPVMTEQSYVHLETMVEGYFDYRQHFADFYQIFFSTHWGYGSSILGPNDDLSFSTGIIQWISGLLGVILAGIGFKKHRKASILVFVLAVVELGVLFMMHQKSSFIWARLPFMVMMQFPWRFLAVSIFLLPILAAFAIDFLGNNRMAKGVGGVVIVVAIAMTITFFQPKDWFSMTDQQLFSGQSLHKLVTASIFDYLPIYAKLPPVTKAPALPEVLEGQVKFDQYYKGSDYQFGQIEVSKESLLRLPLFDFPGMQVKVDGKVVSHWHNDCRDEEFCLGLITLSVPPGIHTIDVRLTNTWPRLVGNIFTGVGLIIVVFLLILGVSRKNLLEYDTAEILEKTKNE